MSTTHISLLLLLSALSLLQLQANAATEPPYYAEDEELEASIARMVEGDGEDVTGKSSSSSSSTFRRLSAVCADAAVSFRDKARSPELEQVYSDFARDLQQREVSHFLHSKIVPSE